MDAEDSGEVMTLTDVAEYLQLAERTVLRMAQRGEIPAAKVASQWRFLRPLVREWLVGHMQTFSLSSVTEASSGRPALLPLGEVLHADLMTFDIEPGPKESVLRQLMAPLVRTGFAKDPARLLAGLVDRERLMTTAVGHGIAIPHPRHTIAGMFPEPAIAVGLCPRGTDFRAIDDQLVHVFFLICATREEVHLQLMARLSWLTRREEVVANLRQAGSAQQVLALAGDEGKQAAPRPGTDGKPIRSQAFPEERDE
ncbi:MAG TPA: PTS sugar transporter subunit IIA [Phycisphaerae bacterium]|nr:PTS sugar transporter subunit IIA [Phycisphaerae bacterium]